MKETIIIRESRYKNIGMLFLSSGIIAALIWGLLWYEAGENLIRYYEIKVLSFLVLPFVVLLFFVTAWKIIKSPPLLPITENGFGFHYRFNRTLFMNWEAVSEISVVKIHASKFGLRVGTSEFLCVSVKNRDKYVASLPKAGKWMAGLSNWFGYPQVVQIPMRLVKDYNPEGVLAIMREYLNNSKQ